MSYERTLRVVLVVDALLALILLLSPGLITAAPVHSVEGTSGWARAAGLIPLLFVLALLPAAVVARANQYLSALAAAAHGLLGILFLFSGGPWLLALYFFASAYFLGTAFWRGFREYLLSKP
ncbi:MAG: hypothetical protein HWD60_02360 [Defluviicoccus sp.]|nr:MAG: hypothetical protein HWD60_02360 [Defluviicoccus sp.]